MRFILELVLVFILAQLGRAAWAGTDLDVFLRGPDRFAFLSGVAAVAIAGWRDAQRLDEAPLTGVTLLKAFAAAFLVMGYQFAQISGLLRDLEAFAGVEAGFFAEAFAAAPPEMRSFLATSFAASAATSLVFYTMLYSVTLQVVQATAGYGGAHIDRSAAERMFAHEEAMARRRARAAARRDGRTSAEGLRGRLKA